MKQFSLNIVAVVFVCAVYLVGLSGMRAEAHDVDTANFVEVNNTQLYYEEAGDESADAFLFLHGNASSSYLWRNVMPSLEGFGRVVAIDLAGAGKSDKPVPGLTFQDQSVLLKGFIDALNLKNITIIAHDWGGPLGMEYARRNPQNVRAVVMMETVTPPRFPINNYSEMGIVEDIFRSFRDPVKGREHVVENTFIETLLVGDLVTGDMDEVVRDKYREPFLTQESRESLYMWPNELPIEGVPARNVDAFEKLEKWLETSKTPKLLLYANPGAIITVDEALWMQSNYRNFESIFIGSGRHYVQEEQAEAISRNILGWYLRNFEE